VFAEQQTAPHDGYLFEVSADRKRIVRCAHSSAIGEDAGDRDGDAKRLEKVARQAVEEFLGCERESGGLLIAILLEKNPPGYGHAQMLDGYADLARVRAPSIVDVRIAKHVVANVDLGGDGHPYVGEVEDGLWMIAGFGGHGVMHAPPVAQLLAKIIAGRPDPTLDISSLSPWRKPGAASEWMVASKKG